MTTQPAYLTLQSGTSRYLTQAAGTNYYLTLNDPAPYDNDVDLLLAEAAWYIDAHDSNYSGGQSVPNMGTAGTALNAQMGSGTAVDTNDPKWLAYSAADGAYVYQPGGASNYMTAPGSTVQVTGDLDILVRVALDDYTATAVQTLIAKDDGSTARSWSFDLDTISNGSVLFLTWTTNGATATRVVQKSTVAPTVTDGAAYWLRATLDVDAGGQYEVKFYQAADSTTVPSSWTQIGTTKTGATGPTSVYASTRIIEVGGIVNVQTCTGKFYRAIVKDGIDGTTVLDIDTSVLTSGSQTSFTATTGQTVTVNRSTSGRKTTLVGGWAGGGSLWLFGTDDYMEVPDNDAIDFGASDSFTVLAVVRIWTALGSAARVIAKGSGPSYSFRNTGTSNNMTFHLSDGVTAQAAYSDYTYGALTAFTGVVDRTAQTERLYANGVSGATASISAVGTFASANPLRVATQPAAYADMEFAAAAIWRRALTAGEIDGLNRYFANRAYNG